MINWLTTLILRIVGVVSRNLSQRGRTALGRFLGNVIRWVSSSRYAVTLDNLSHAFPDKTVEWKRATADAAYHNLGITLAELMAFPALTEADIRSMITYKNLDLIEEAGKEGKGVILLSAHYGNWELLAFALPLFTAVPVSVIVKPQQNTYADTLLNTYRTRTGNALISMYRAARDIVRLLSEGKAIALLADQSATADKDIFVPFFGRPAATYEAPAALALRFNAPIVMGFAERQQDGSYIVDLHRIPHEDLAYDSEGITELTRRHVAMLEEAVRKRPDLWVWQHRRWKHRPPVEEVV